MRAAPQFRRRLDPAHSPHNSPAMICSRCQDGVHSLCANTHRRVGPAQLADADDLAMAVPFGYDLFIKRDVPATTWCDCAHEDSPASTQRAEGTTRTDYRDMTYDHVTGTISGAPR